MLNVKSATHPDRDKQANIRDSNDIAKHTNIKSMLTVKSTLTTVKVITTSLHSRSVLSRVIVEFFNKGVQLK